MLPVCPKCDVALLVLTYRGVEADICNRCHGFWLDTGEVQTILEIAGTRVDDPALEFLDGPPVTAVDRLCPRCDLRMSQIRSEAKDDSPPIVLDKCPKGHGIWFDRNELENILRRFRPMSNAPPAIAFLQDMFGAVLGEPAVGPSDG